MSQFSRSPTVGRESQRSGRAARSTSANPSPSPTHIMSTRSASARARANDVSDPPMIHMLPNLSGDGAPEAEGQDGVDDADDEDDETGDVIALSGHRTQGRRAGRPRSMADKSPKGIRRASPTIDELLRDQDYHMVDYEDFEDSASVMDRFSLDDITQDLASDAISDIDPELQQILSGDTMTASTIRPSIEDPFAHAPLSLDTHSAYNPFYPQPGLEGEQRRLEAITDDSDPYQMFKSFIGPYPTLRTKRAKSEARARLDLAIQSFSFHSMPSTPLRRHGYGIHSGDDAGYETDENPMPGSNTLRPSALHQPRAILAPLSPFSDSSPTTVGRRQGPPMGTFEVDKRKAHAKLHNDGDTLLIFPATAIDHDCDVSQAIEEMANGTFEVSQRQRSISPEPQFDGADLTNRNREELRALARQGANLLEESFAGFTDSLMSPPSDPLTGNDPLDDYKAMSCINQFIAFGSDDDEDDNDVLESMDTSVVATQTASPTMANEATFAPSADYMAEIADHQGLVDPCDESMLGAFRRDPDVIAQNPYATAFEDDSLTSPLFPSQSSILSPKKRRRDSIPEDSDTEQRPEKRAHFGPSIEIGASDY